MKWTADKVFEKLAKRYPSPAFALLSQVRNGTGFARKKDRTADAVAVSVWPSRGLYMTGIEIKVSKSDWRRELAAPDKAGEMQAYCLYWYVAAPKGVISPGEVPETWGLLEVDGRGVSETVTAPKLLQPNEPDWLLLCSILRNAAQSMVSRDEHLRTLAEERADMEETAKKAAKALRLERENDELKRGIQRFEEASGVSIGGPWNAERIGNAVKIVLESGVCGTMSAAKRLRSEAQRIVDSLDKVLERTEA